MEINDKILRLEEDRGTLIEIYEIIDPPKMIHTKLLPAHIQHMKQALNDEIKSNNELRITVGKYLNIRTLFKNKPDNWVEDMYKLLDIKNDK